MILGDIPIGDYHASPALSKSKLMDYAKHGPNYYFLRWVARTLVTAETPSLRFGRLFDAICEHGPVVASRWATIPCDLRTTEGKAWRAVNAHREQVSEDDLALLLEMYDAIRNNRAAQDAWFGDAVARQRTIIRDLPQYGTALQSRPDGLDLDRKRVIDIKTTKSLDAFTRDAITYGYHVQLAIGQWLLAKEGHQCDALLIAVESCPGARCRVYRLPEVALSAGWALAKRLIEEISERMKKSDWIDEQNDIEELRLPLWQERQLFEDSLQ